MLLHIISRDLDEPQTRQRAGDVSLGVVGRNNARQGDRVQFALIDAGPGIDAADHRRSVMHGMVFRKVGDAPWEPVLFYVRGACAVDDFQSAKRNMNKTVVIAFADP